MEYDNTINEFISKVLYTQRSVKVRLVTTRKHNLNEGGFPLYFVVKEALRRISEETRLLVTRLS